MLESYVRTLKDAPHNFLEGGKKLRRYHATLQPIPRATSQIINTLSNSIIIELAALGGGFFGAILGAAASIPPELITQQPIVSYVTAGVGFSAGVIFGALNGMAASPQGRGMRL